MVKATELSKKAIIAELKELDAELDEIFERRAELKAALTEKYGEAEAAKLFDLLRWTI